MLIIAGRPTTLPLRPAINTCGEGFDQFNLAPVTGANLVQLSLRPLKHAALSSQPTRLHHLVVVDSSGRNGSVGHRALQATYRSK